MEDFRFFLKIADQSGLTEGLNNAKLYYNRLKVFKVESIVSNLFQLILGILSKLISDTNNKGLVVSEIFLEKSFKVRPRDRNGIFVTALMLSSSETNSATEVKSSKQGAIHPDGA